MAETLKGVQSRLATLEAPATAATNKELHKSKFLELHDPGADEMEETQQEAAERVDFQQVKLHVAKHANCTVQTEAKEPPYFGDYELRFGMDQPEAKDKVRLPPSSTLAKVNMLFNQSLRGPSMSTMKKTGDDNEWSTDDIAALPKPDTSGKIFIMMKLCTL
jgi:hypothetical protein